MDLKILFFFNIPIFLLIFNLLIYESIMIDDYLLDSDIDSLDKINLQTNILLLINFIYSITIISIDVDYYLIIHFIFILSSINHYLYLYPYAKKLDNNNYDLLALILLIYSYIVFLY